MTKEDFKAEIAEKIKAGIKPSDLKKSRSTPTPSRSFDQEKYLQELEQEKADLLAKLANYEQEQRVSVKVFQDQENLLDQKEQQLIAKDEELTEQQEQISQLKARIHQLSQEKKDLKQLTKNAPEVIDTSQQTTQTTGTSTEELEDQALAKRLILLKTAPSPPNTNFPSKRAEIEKNVLIIFLLVILIGTLLFK